MWKKCTPKKGRRPGKSARTTPAVFRSRGGKQQALLVLPGSFAPAEKCDIYESGGRMLAFQMHDAGKFHAKSAGHNTPTKRVTIPHKYAHRIPYGTTDVTLTRDGDMLVLDLDQLPQPAVDLAAE